MTARFMGNDARRDFFEFENETQDHMENFKKCDFLGICVYHIGGGTFFAIGNSRSARKTEGSYRF